MEKRHRQDSQVCPWLDPIAKLAKRYTFVGTSWDLSFLVSAELSSEPGTLGKG
jgi:hypothetical protein